MPDLDREVRREVERMARRVDTAKAFSGIMRRVRRRRLLRTLQKASIAAVVLAGTTLSVLGLLRLFGNPSVPGEGATRIAIASTTIESTLRIDLVAERASGRDPTAVVRAVVRVRRHGRWRITDRTPLRRREGWRWSLVTGPGGVCRFAAGDSFPRARVEVQLAASAAGGCSAPLGLRLERGRVVVP